MAVKSTRTAPIGEVNDFLRSFDVVASTRNPVKGADTLADGSVVERLEVLESWNLTRFLDNPVILWQHDGQQSAIGLASNVRETDAGLEMTITLAAPSDEPWATEALKRVKAKLVRGVSVGFDFGAETKESRGGQQVSVFRGNELSEVSLVTIPADAGALVGDAPPALTAEDAERLKLSDAAKNLASGRKKKADGSDEEFFRVETLRFDAKASKIQRTQLGGIRVPARLTRTGVLVYRDGTGVRRELRPPEEVFDAASLESLRSATVTDAKHHTAFIDTRTWKDAALGHIENVRTDSKQFVEADLVINDARTVLDVENERLSDISCGYSCRHDAKPGTWNGEPYDVVQREIRYNHVAVLPPGRGRAGTDVGIRLDSTDAECVEEPTPHQEHMKTIRLDGKDYEVGSDAHLEKISELHSKELQAEKDRAVALQKSHDALQANFDAKAQDAKKAEEAEKSKRDKEKADTDAMYRKRLKLMQRALRFMDDEDSEESGESGTSKKMDAMDPAFERDVMLKVIRLDEKDFGETDSAGTARSEAYIEARFDMACANLQKARGVHGVVAKLELAKRLDARDASDPVDKAESDHRKRASDAWKTPLQASTQKGNV